MEKIIQLKTIIKYQLRESTWFVNKYVYNNGSKIPVIYHNEWFVNLWDLKNVFSWAMESFWLYVDVVSLQVCQWKTHCLAGLQKLSTKQRKTYVSFQFTTKNIIKWKVVGYTYFTFWGSFRRVCAWHIGSWRSSCLSSGWGNGRYLSSADVDENYNHHKDNLTSHFYKLWPFLASFVPNIYTFSLNM